MEEINVRVLNEYKGNINPDRKYHLINLETGRIVVGNLKQEEIEHYAKLFHLTLAE